MGRGAHQFRDIPLPGTLFEAARTRHGDLGVERGPGPAASAWGVCGPRRRRDAVPSAPIPPHLIWTTSRAIRQAKSVLAYEEWKAHAGSGGEAITRTPIRPHVVFLDVQMAASRPGAFSGCAISIPRP